MHRELADIPEPSGLPLLGNLLQIPRSRLAQHLLRTSRDFDGIFQLNFAGRKVPFAYSQEIVAELCDQNRFRKVVGPPLSFLRKIAGDGLFTSDSNDPNWGKAHRILLPAFSQRAMKSYFDVMLDVVNQLADKWAAKGQNEDILVADDMTRLTLETIALSGFDYPFKSFESDGLHPFLEAMVRTLSAAMARLTQMPFMHHLKPRDVQNDHDIATMNGLVDEVIAQRRRAPSQSHDLLNLMLEAIDPKSGEALDDVNIRYQVITFLIAGHETTSGLLSFAMYMLLRHPAVLSQAYAEVDRILPGDTVPEFGHLAKLSVIERILKETLRLWPTAPAFAVAPFEDTVLAGRYRVRKDQRVSIVLTALHRDPKIWINPESFDIDRFLPEREAALPAYAYLPFGNGQRACIGRQFALTEAKLALAVILQRFALFDPHDYQFRIKETLTLKPDDLRIRVRARLPHERVVQAASPAMATFTAEAPRPIALQTGQPMTVLYGSSLGTAQDLAEDIARQAAERGFQVEFGAIDEFFETLPSSGILIVVAATYNGRAPDSARRLEAMLDQNTDASANSQGLRFAVLGCGNSQWTTYQAFPTRVANWLAKGGATPVLERGEADGNGDLDGDAERWIEHLWAALGQQVAQQENSPALTIEYIDAEMTVQDSGAAQPQNYTVLANEELVHDATGLWDFSIEAPRPSTRRIDLAAPPGTSYKTGDHLAVYPHNSTANVSKALAVLGLTHDQIVVLRSSGFSKRGLPYDRPIAVGHLLRNYLELQDVISRSDIRRLLAVTQCPHTRSDLEQLAAANDATYDTEITAKRLNLLNFLDRYRAIPCTLELFIQCVSIMRARLYSISSSALVWPDRITLTVGTVQGQGPSGFQGVASNYIGRSQVGEQLFAVVRQPQPIFAPSSDPSVAMIMIGPGTGIAPFRAFVEERAAQKAAGLTVACSLLLYGCRHPEHDWLFRKEFAHWEAQGVVKVVAAYSTLDSHPYRYVQHALWEHRRQILNLLESGATLYVCGDGKSMAPSVRDTMIRMHQDRFGSDHSGASAWLKTLIDQGYYKQDVYS